MDIAWREAFNDDVDLVSHSVGDSMKSYFVGKKIKTIYVVSIFYSTNKYLT